MDYFQRAMFRHSMSDPKSLSVIKGVTGEKSVKQLMAELRETNPEEAMLLGEYIVLDDEEDEG